MLSDTLDCSSPQSRGDEGTLTHRSRLTPTTAGEHHGPPLAQARAIRSDPQLQSLVAPQPSQA